MQLSELSDSELITKLDLLAARERTAIVEVLFHLIEFENQSLFRELGYASLFDYCTQTLKYSQPSAYRRLAAARALKLDPSIAEHLQNGSLTLSALALAAKSIEAKVTTVPEILGRSQREVERLVAAASPLPKAPREVVKPIAVGWQDSFWSQPKEERVQVTFSLARKEYERFETAKSKLSNALGQELTVEGVVMKLLQKFLTTKERKVKSRSAVNSRYIPKAVKRAVYSRDKGQCTYTSADGHRCTATKYLHFDHIRPFAHGGESTTENLRLLCSCHNKLMAEQDFGKEFIEKCADSQR